ncbi:YjgN family protein [Thalassospira lucentensis]|uniref:DUF898 domain-containing protein n=1 Tax=Thalassospira lucentensis TaxID=168935 RepID=A0A358HWZ7_9PROT|nr:DUF898 family protein [Thalassospira lucentensis]HBU99679.1 hypothetical protein [Thalassospira lucentensis]HCW66750.1 hypothetical protein [Thalassospira lucentensis]
MSTENTEPRNDGPNKLLSENSTSEPTANIYDDVTSQNTASSQDHPVYMEGPTTSGTGGNEPPHTGQPWGNGPSDGAPSHGQPGDISYFGRWQDVLKLCCWNTLWTILTLGIFRFWAKTRMRRYIWSNIVIDGDALEYTGRGLELFLGFVIVTLIFVPVILALNLIGSMLPAHLMMLPMIFTYIAVAFLFFVATYRATRYRYSRTFWRGIRARLSGSAFKYALIGFGTSIVTLLSLGLLAPLGFIATTRYQTDNTWIGDTQARFNGTFGAAFKRWLKSWAILVLVVGSVIALSAVASGPSMIWLPIAAGVIAYFGVAFVFLNYNVWLFRYQADCTEMGAIRFSSNLQTSQYIKIILRFLGLSLLLLIVAGLLMLVFGGFAAFSAFNPGNAGNPQQIAAVFIPIVIAMLLIGPLLSIVGFTFMIHSMLAADISSLAYQGEITDLHANAEAQNIPRTGEGLAEAFDLGGI